MTRGPGGRTRPPCPSAGRILAFDRSGYESPRESEVTVIGSYARVSACCDVKGEVGLTSQVVPVPCGVNHRSTCFRAPSSPPEPSRSSLYPCSTYETTSHQPRDISHEDETRGSPYLRKQDVYPVCRFRGVARHFVACFLQELARGGRGHIRGREDCFLRSGISHRRVDVRKKPGPPLRAPPCAAWSARHPQTRRT